MSPLIKSLKPSIINRITLRPTNGQLLITLLTILLLTSPAASLTPPAPEPYQTDNIKHGLGLIVFVLTVFIFFMAFFSIYLRHCSDARNGVGIGGGGRISAVIIGRSRRGLDPAVLGTFPVFDYSAVKEMKIGKGALECAVCINEFEDHETLRLIPHCDHVFHSECIDMWLDSHATCPVCRANLADDPPVAAQTTTAETGTRSDDVAVDVAARQVGESMEQPLNAGPRRSLVRSRTRVGSFGRRRWFGLFMRSHSTGHVAVSQPESLERFTLRLPEEVRRQIFGGKLSRTTSCLAPSTVESKYRVGDRVGFGGSYKEGSSQLGKFGSDRVNRWGFPLTTKMATPDGLKAAPAAQPGLPPV